MENSLNNAARLADSAETLRAPLFLEEGFSHAFFTRRGGVSEPPFDSLSFSVAQGDKPDSVKENRIRAAIELGVSERSLFYLSQVHGTASRTLGFGEDPDEVVKEIGDITLSQSPEVACGVRSADCVPVLIADKKSGAVAAIHSGWKGTIARVAAIGTEQLRALSGPGSNFIAAIGPHISVCCFEVGDDVAMELAQASSISDAALSWGPASTAMVAKTGATMTRRVDLRMIVRAQLISAGIPKDQIVDVFGCTFCDPLRFHSFRRDAQNSGRLLSAIVPRKPTP